MPFRGAVRRCPGCGGAAAPALGPRVGGGLGHLPARAPDPAARGMAGADAALPPKLLSSLRVPVIVGPTGIGKSQLAFRLALEVDGEVVVADSKQVYRRLDIATNKPSPEQREQVRYHMVDFIDPVDGFNAAQYVQGARAAVEDIAARGKTPIV